jgi:hypothetical protein
MWNRNGLLTLHLVRLVPLACGFINRINASVVKIEDNIKEMPLRYVTKDDYRDDIAEIKGMLGKIFDRLESKADK